MTIVVYRDAVGEWRWHLVAGNGRVVADSAESYKRRQHAIGMADKIAAGGHRVEVRG